MPARIIVLTARYIAVILLVIALLLIFVRWRFPRANEGARRGRRRASFWRAFLSAHRESKAKQRSRRQDIQAIRGRSVLVVDPDEKSSRVLMWRLNQLGCKVTQARTGRQAIALARAEHPEPVEGRSGAMEVIVSDALLPDISAADFCEAVRRTSLPIVLVGVLRDQLDTLREFESVALLAKPYDPDDVAALAGRMLRDLTFQPRRL